MTRRRDAMVYFEIITEIIKILLLLMIAVGVYK
jgi:hypothetical protein